MARHSIRQVTGSKRRGATALTYGLVVGLVAVAGIAAVTRVGESVDILFGTVGSTIEQSATGTDAGRTPTPTPTPTDAPRRDVYYQCHGRSSFVVFAENTNNHAVTTGGLQTFLDFAQACRDLGFAPVATADNSFNDPFGFSDEIQALACNNCDWSPGGNVWTYHQDSPRSDCVAQNPDVAGSLSSGEILAGFVVHSVSGMGAYVLNGTTDPISAGNGSGMPSPSSPFSGVEAGGDGNFNSIGNEDIFYTGTPDFLLCASASGP